MNSIYELSELNNLYYLSKLSQFCQTIDYRAWITTFDIQVNRAARKISVDDDRHFLKFKSVWQTV